MTWHIITPEYPPGCGGVGDYAALIADGLSRHGDRVRVWHPRELPDRFGERSRKKLASAIAAEPGIVFVQYVPAAFGLHGLNVPFCRWLAQLAGHGTDVRVMFHEPFFYYGVRRPWRNILALVQRVMAVILLRAAARVYYSSEAWTPLLGRYTSRRDAEVLPIPATIPVDVSAEAVAAARTGRRGPLVVGHFGTYGEHVARELSPLLRVLALRLPEARVMLVGRGAQRFAQSLDANLRRHVDVFDAQDGAAIAATLRACDLLVQPYPDGVTTRRTSMMAALTTGLPVVSTVGALTEAVWKESDAVALAPAGDVNAIVSVIADLVGDAESRRALGARGRRLYDEQFALEATLSRIRRA